MSTQDWDLLSSYAGLLTLACGSIYCGAYGSLPNPKPAPGSARKEDDEDDEEVVERMSSGDAWMFPVIGSATLFSLYVVVKYLGPEWINWLLGWYFSLAGVASVWKSSISIVRTVVGEEKWKSFKLTKVGLKWRGNWWYSMSLRTPAIYLMPFAAIPSILYSFTGDAKKSALLTNLLSLSFCHTTLSLLKLDSFNTGCILLSGLFFYDIWWVFGTEVMVKVATSLDVPIKLLWPKSLEFATTRGFTMLGLGDIVIPGCFVALGLRYDYFRSTQGTRSFPKPYFHATLIAYAFGLIATMAVMHTFGKAQPALLYLSPSCILSFFITAVAKGELTEAWKWSEEPKEEAAEGAAKENGHTKSE
ncbi:hypothetical protein PC9H_007343 [Pleurotus ostreatus]|uniref:Minor histocompatibility antigen H13 n=1 Tax=Pleurotus ostreatus TaxID=5322 RepID=A0A8H6ZT87_PLEOS|nr:uncharacterized protein PC9H_007343 [Pleurotus ostreatus]KAF7428124.1 hypothetical protein PC9H_007343 [Pleurotus ostreatus]KAJ8696184.1 hypothetical protein PTI98_006072 [Pleurotus ostreatus]